MRSASPALALCVLALLASPSLVCTASSSSSSLSPAQPAPAAAPTRFVRPRFQPAGLVRQPRRKRQDTTTPTDGSSGDGTGGSDGGTGTGADTSAGGSDGAATTTSAAPEPTTTQQTSQPAETTTTAAQETTTQAQQDPTTSQGQATTTQGTTSSPNDSTTSYGTTTTPGQVPSSSSSTPAASDAASTSSSSPASSLPSDSTSANSQSHSSQSLTQSDVTLTYTSTFTNADGSVGTSTGTHVTQSSVPVRNNSEGGSSSGKTWGIVGGVVGGVILIGGIVFIAYRMTQRRFSSLDNDDVEEFKWPDLQPDGQTISTATSTLKPLETHRTTGTHGIGDDGDDGLSTYRSSASGPAGDVRAAGALYAPAGTHDPSHPSGGSYADPYAHSRQASAEQLAMIDGGAAAYAAGYDPFPGGPIGHALPPGAAGGMVYPPTPPQYRSPSASPYAQQQSTFTPPMSYYDDSQEHLDVHSPAAGPRGAPGAGGAARALSPVGGGGDAGELLHDGYRETASEVAGYGPPAAHGRGPL